MILDLRLSFSISVFNGFTNVGANTGADVAQNVTIRVEFVKILRRRSTDVTLKWHKCNLCVRVIPNVVNAVNAEELKCTQ